MNQIIRLYNQNRKKFWTIVIVIILVYTLIRLLNYWVKNSNNEVESTNNIAYYEEGESIISDDDVPEYNREMFGTLISSFLDYCISGNTNDAYNLLSDDCKEELFPHVEDFENLYRSKNFSTSKTYTFQSWTSQTTNIYQVKIFDNSLYTGNASFDDYIEDYFNIVYENGQAKLNISGFVKVEDINKSTTVNNVLIQVNKIHYFMDYCTADIVIQNSSDKTILIDTMEKTNTVFMQSSNNNTKLIGFLSDFSQEDMIVQANDNKILNIRLIFKYRDSLRIQSINFTDVVMDYEAFMQGGLLNSDRQEFIVEI